MSKPVAVLVCGRARQPRNLDDGVLWQTRYNDTSGIDDPAVIDTGALVDVFGGHGRVQPVAGSYTPRKLSLYAQCQASLGMQEAKQNAALAWSDMQGRPSRITLGTLFLDLNWRPADQQKPLGYKSAPGYTVYRWDGEAADPLWKGSYQYAVGAAQSLTVADDRIDRSDYQVSVAAGTKNTQFTWTPPGDAAYPLVFSFDVPGNASTTVYVKNSDPAFTRRVAVATDAQSTGYISEAMQLMCWGGQLNCFRIEDKSGNLLTTTGTGFAGSFYGSVARFVGNGSNRMSDQPFPLRLYRQGAAQYISAADTLSSAVDGQPRIGIPGGTYAAASAGLVLEPATTNLLPTANDASFESGVGSWAAFGGAVATSSADRGLSGTHSLKIVGGSATASKSTDNTGCSIVSASGATLVGSFNLTLTVSSATPHIFQWSWGNASSQQFSGPPASGTQIALADTSGQGTLTISTDVTPPTTPGTYTDSVTISAVGVSQTITGLSANTYYCASGYVWVSVGGTTWGDGPITVWNQANTSKFATVTTVSPAIGTGTNAHWAWFWIVVKTGGADTGATLRVEAGDGTVYWDCLQFEQSVIPTSWAPGNTTRNKDVCGLWAPHNLVLDSRAFDQWTAAGTGSATPAANNATGSDGLVWADTWTVAANSSNTLTSPAYTVITNPNNTGWWVVVRLKLGTYAESLRLRLMGSSDGGTTYTSQASATFAVGVMSSSVYTSLGFYIASGGTGVAATVTQLQIEIDAIGFSGGTVLLESARLIYGSHPGVDVYTTGATVNLPENIPLDPGLAWRQNGGVKFSAILPPISTGANVYIFGDAGDLWSIKRPSAATATQQQVTITRSTNGTAATQTITLATNVWDGTVHTFEFICLNYTPSGGSQTMLMRLYVDGTLVSTDTNYASASVTKWVSPERFWLSDGSGAGTFSALKLSDLTAMSPAIPAGSSLAIA